MAQGRKGISQRLREAGHTKKRLSAPISLGSPATEPPEGITDDVDALEVWHEVCKSLIADGLFKLTDRSTIERYAVAMSINRQAARIVLKGGWSQQAKSGYSAVTSQFTAFDKSSRLCVALEKQLGLTVDARKSLRLREGDAEADELEEFLAQHDK